MTDNKEQLANELPPPKRQVARSNRAGSTKQPPAGFCEGFSKLLRDNGLPDYQRSEIMHWFWCAWFECAPNDPPPAEKATDSAHELPTGMTDERLAEVKARAEAATPGPWHHDRVDFDSGMTLYEIWGGKYREHGWLAHVEDNKPNADFISHARQDIPELLAEVERLREQVASLEHAYKDSRERIREMEKGVMF